MSGALLIPPEAADAQHRSSDPGASVWVSANAGAGKTYVLAQRVVRLLLDGVEPGAILCLTYTNAAAAEMAGRVFKRLAELAVLPQEALLDEVARLAPEVPADEAAIRARTLFARTLETPGGIKVQTVHAFAAALLRRFPLEANVSGAFSILDDATRIELTDRAIAATLGEGATIPDGPVAATIATIVPFVSDADIGNAVKAMLAERTVLADWLRPGTHPDRLSAMLGEALGRNDTIATAPLFDDDDCRDLMARLRSENVSLGTAEAIESALLAPDPAARETIWRAIFLKKDGTPRASVVAKRLTDADPRLEDRLAAEQARLVACAEQRRIADTTEVSVALAQLAYRVHTRIEAEKRRRGLIDYDDQITTAMQLVQGATAAEWVRYKLDEGIDHLMLDEAQDTSPAQWELVDALTGEFFAGASANPRHRTLFVVGDEKQSIYSFQGAAPDLFAEMRSHYGALAAGAEKSFSPIDLQHSFRSAPQVLSAVDTVFADPALAASVGASPNAVRHAPVRGEVGGVDVWPLLCDDDQTLPRAWDAPLDQRPDWSGDMKLARAIADQIEAWRETGPDGGRPVDPGGVMILTRRRGTFAALMNRELKARGIPAAGADRLDVTTHIAVADMLALARALISVDDLSLAAVLKSPLFGFGEDALFRLAHGREGSLFNALAHGDEAARTAHATLRRWRNLATRTRPFDFFAGILVGEGRRADFAARMGSEAEDALDAFLDIALDFEARGIAAMEPFLMRLSRMSSEITRTAEGDGGKVRVMTVHGAKGLEADVVFLADIGSSARPPSSRTAVPLDHGAETRVLAYVAAKETRPAPVTAVLDGRQAAETAEHHRLLYVGMTRAERQLVVCGAYGKNRPAPGMWHALVSDALAGAAERRDGPLGEMLAWRLPPPAGPAPARAATRPPHIPPATPAYLMRAAPALPRAPEPIAPSGEHTDAITLSGNDRPLPAAAFGTLMHGLIEMGGPADALAAEVRRRYPSLHGAAEAIAGEAFAARNLPEFAGREIVQELDVIGDVRMPTGTVRRAFGRIDLVAIGDREALVVDFKTDRAVPLAASGVPPGYRQQLAIYRALVGAILSCPVRTALVYTADPRLLMMDEALPRIVLAHPPA
ncbi:MAG: double-strand break repair helicase AddA [Acuticoccus sp.]